jgi:hypothetical protein
MTASAFVPYHGALATSRKAFLLTHGEFVKAYDQIHAALERLPSELCVQRDIEGHSLASFIPFMALLSRQTLFGFDHLASFQSYQAWMTVRPAVEIPLYIGKWLDDPAAAKVWAERETNPKAYMKEYGGGKALRSNALVQSSEIQSVLKHLNDQFVHPNPFYYYRHLDMSRVGNGKVSMEIGYFDDQAKILPHLLAFLHLTCFIHDALRDSLSQAVGTTKNTEPLLPGLLNQFGDKADEIHKADETGRRILIELGCWHASST